MVTMVTTIAEEIDEFEVKEKGLVGYCVTCDPSVLYDEPHAIQDDTVICLDCIEDTVPALEPIHEPSALLRFIE